MKSSVILRVALFAFLAMIPIQASAAGIDAHKVTSSEIKKLSKAPGHEIKSYFSGYTFLFNNHRAPQGAYPDGGPAFIHFAPNGRFVSWSGVPRPTYSGTWEAGWLGDNETLLCLDFKHVGGNQPCLVLEGLGGRLIYERAKGNVFGLKAGKIINTNVLRHKMNFKDASKLLGLD